MKIQGDIDIDFADRTSLLKHIEYTSAAMREVTPIRKHPSGIYPTSIPYDPFNDMSSLDYVEAENRGYFKIDLLNVHVYTQVKNENHLIELMRDPDWTLLQNREFVENLIHIGNHYNSLMRMPEPVDSIIKLSMFLAVIRPGKKHLIGKPWAEISKTVWDKTDEGFAFKRSHSIAYSQLVIVHMNLLSEQKS